MEKPSGDLPQRIDKWLFFTRLVKTRAIAQDLISAGAIRVNGQAVLQASRTLKAGDRIDMRLERRDVTVVVKDAAPRRGPYAEARLLYEDLTPADQERLTPFERAQRRL